MGEISLGKTLATLRTAKGVTQEELAAALSVSNKTVSKWENGDSFPDLPALCALADYFEVTTDHLLGRESEAKDLPGFVSEQLRGLNRKEAAPALFGMLRATYMPLLEAARKPGKVCADPFPQNTDHVRDCISTPDLYHFLVCSDEVSFGVTLWQNADNYRWLLREESQERIGTLLTFLADRNVMKVLYLLHAADCPQMFTVEFAAKRTGLDPENTREILQRCFDIGLCRTYTAHLVSGTTELYESCVRGLLLAILSLAYEHTFGKEIYDYNFNGKSQLIREEKQ